MTSPLKLELNLQQTAMIQIAINCWKDGEIKNNMKNHVAQIDITKIDSEVREKENMWISEVIHKFENEIILPDPLRFELNDIIAEVGRRMIQWLIHKCQAPIFHQYVDNVFWTPYGTIDEVKILDELCVDQKLENIPYLYEEACMLCSENHIEELWNKLSTAQKSDIKSKLLHSERNRSVAPVRDFNRYMLGYWALSEDYNVYLADFLFANYEPHYNLNSSLQANNFRFAVASGHECAAKYFFNQLNDEEKRTNITGLLEKLLRIGRDMSVNETVSASYSSEKCSDILNYLVHQMWSIMGHSLLEKFGVEILKDQIRKWPWDFVFFSTFKHSRLNDRQCYQLLDRVTVRLMYASEFVTDLKYFRFYRILVGLWRELSPVFKQKLARGGFAMFFELPIRISNVSFLKYVARDPDVAPVKKKFLQNIRKSFFNLFTAWKHHIVEEILKEVFLCTDEECVKFKKALVSFPVCLHFVKNDQFDRLHDFLLWQRGSEAEVNQFKIFFRSELGCLMLCEVWHGRQWYEAEWVEYVTRHFFEYFEYNAIDMENLRNEMINSDNRLRNIAKCGETTFYTFLHCCQFSQEFINQMMLRFLSQNLNLRKLDSKIN